MFYTDNCPLTRPLYNSEKPELYGSIIQKESEREFINAKWIYIGYPILIHLVYEYYEIRREFLTYAYFLKIIYISLHFKRMREIMFIFRTSLYKYKIKYRFLYDMNYKFSSAFEFDTIVCTEMISYKMNFYI